MRLIADVLMIVGALSVSLYCAVLAKRLSRFTGLEKGMGGAIAMLSAQVDDMTKMLVKTQKTAAGSAEELEVLTKRAEAAASRLELLVASMHDLPEPAPASQSEAPARPREPKATPTIQEPNSPEKPLDTLFLSQRRRVEAAE